MAVTVPKTGPEGFVVVIVQRAGVWLRGGIQGCCWTWFSVGDLGLLQRVWGARVSGYQCLALCKAVQVHLGSEMLNTAFSVSLDCPAGSVL